MRIVFLNPPNINTRSYAARSANRWPHNAPVGNLFRKSIFPTYPIYMAYTAAVAEEAGFDVVIIDAAASFLTVQQVLDEIVKLQPGLVVMETSAPTRKHDLMVSRRIKKCIDVHVNLIGSHATVSHKEFLTDYTHCVDSVSLGEYFYIPRDLAHALENSAPLQDVPGLAFCESGTVVANQQAALVDVDTLPLPARHLLDPREYTVGHYTYAPQLLMVGSFGCPFRCIFCLWTKTLYNHSIRLRDPKMIVKEMRLLVEEYGAKEIYFDDDLFNISEERVIKVCDAIIESKLKIPWITEMRVTPVSRRMLEKAKKAGCIKILYGVESGSQEILDKAKKAITLDQVRRAFKLTNEIGIKTHAAFMLGLPGETIDTVERTIKFAKELDPDTIQCSLALPYPGTEFYEIAKRNGSLVVEDWADFDGEMGGVIEYPGLSKEYLRQSMSRMYKEFYVRPRHITRRILGIRSWADIKRFLELVKGYFRRFSSFNQ